MPEALVFVVCVLAVGGLALCVGYFLGRDDREGPAPSPAPEEVIEVASDKEVDDDVRDAPVRDDDLDWLRSWSGPE